MERQRNMITIGDILRPRRIDLRLAASAQEDAIYRVASLLKEDERVKNWPDFYSSLIEKSPCTAAGNEFELCIPHTRTTAVENMVMAVGRTDAGNGFPNPSRRIQYIFVIGVPTALVADYLRIIGALARIFRNDAAEKSLREAPGSERFLSVLTEYEMKL